MDALAILDPPSGTRVDEGELLALRALAAGMRQPGAMRPSGAQAGSIAARRRGRGLDVDDVRLWAPGDDLRHLDRNSTARSGQPHVRRFRDERQRTALLLADFRPSMLFGTRGAFRSVVAARVLALVGWRLATDGFRIGVLACGESEPLYAPPLSGERAMPAAAAALALAHERSLRAPAASDPPLGDALKAAAALLPRDGLAVVASAFESPGADLVEALLALRHRAELTVALVLDAFERQAPRGTYRFVGSSDGPTLWGVLRGGQRTDPAAGRRALLGAAGLVPAEIAADQDVASCAAALLAAHARAG